MQLHVKDFVNSPPLFEGHPRMAAIRAVIESIADTDTTVLIRGESGVGKDLIARAVHVASTRRDSRTSFSDRSLNLANKYGWGNFQRCCQIEDSA